MIHEQIQQMFSEESNDDDFGVFDNLLILVRLIRGFDSRGLIGPRNRCILYKDMTYMRVYMVITK